MTGTRPCELDSSSGGSRVDSDHEDSLGSPAVRLGAGNAAAAAARTRVAAALVEKQQCTAEFAARLDAHFSAFEGSEAAGGRGGMQESAQESAVAVAQAGFCGWASAGMHVGSRRPVHTSPAPPSHPATPSNCLPSSVPHSLWNR